MKKNLNVITNKIFQKLHEGWVIANHILVSFHVAFISSVLSIPALLKGRSVLGFVFTSPDTIISAAFWYISFHTGIALHEMGHYLQAVKLNALNESILPRAQKRWKVSGLGKLAWYFEMYVKIPYGRFEGVKREGLTFYPEAPFNLSVAAAGPAMSGNLALVMLPIAAILLVWGLVGNTPLPVYFGRLVLGIGLVGLLDFLLADPGKYREFREREAKARQKAGKVEIAKESWLNKARQVKEMMMKNRIQTITLKNGDKVGAPWQYRNCGMGGRHTEKDYPESNISMQEMMFLPICAKNYEEAQMITVALQTRLKEIIEKSEGARVMGIGLEGGLAPYISKEAQDLVPEQRMWRMAVQAIRDIGYKPGDEIAIAFDPALSELSNAYREEFNEPDSVGMYYFWRSEEKVVMSRDQLVDIYKKAVEEHPIFSLEDPFAEDDDEGWRLLMKELGDKVFVIGDDNITTKDSTIEACADKGLINAALIKANQIGTLSETLIAMLVALGKKLDLVVSHRSKSPNDDMEAQIALAANAMGLKAGGGANTERLYKYGSVTKIMKELEKSGTRAADKKNGAAAAEFLNDLVITEIIAYEEPTNAGIPSVGVDVYVGIRDSDEYRKVFKFTGSTPLGTSAGTGEAIHLIDSTIEKCPAVEKYPELFAAQADKTYKFKKGTAEADIQAKNDEELKRLWKQVQRYEGKGCQNAVANVLNIIAPEFIGKKVSEFQRITLVDKKLLQLEKETAVKRGKAAPNVSGEEAIEIMQRKGNIGMNAILSMSLALGRMIAHVQGKDLWQLLRAEMKEAVAKAIGEAGGKADKNQPFDELIMGLQKAEEKFNKEGKSLYQTLRKHMPIYG
jgi:enolase